MLAKKVDGGGSGGVLDADDGGVAKHAERVGSQAVAQLLIELHVTNPREHLRRRHELDSFGRVVVFDACCYLLFRFRRQVGESAAANAAAVTLPTTMSAINASANFMAVFPSWLRDYAIAQLRIGLILRDLSGCKRSISTAPSSASVIGTSAALSAQLSYDVAHGFSPRALIAAAIASSGA